ncbi:enoyl-CoA hydratase [Pseudorhodoplanes sp.]|uniref:enoyl-CoA hydratase n=1 Tax=Pseudorhodoplanes sp. TaxID=1934341 RepID=UPI00391C57A9
MNVHARPDGTTILLREKRDGIALLTLNNPAARNALSEELIEALGTAFAEVGRDPSIRAVVVAANGPAFSAGHDLKQLTARRSDADGGKAYFRHVMTSCSAMMQQIVALPQPVIACVSGVATAAGCQLVATCDLAVASSQARFATPGVDIGLFCSTPMVALTRNIPRKNAMHMLLTGEPVTADEALRLGLVNKVVPHGAERDAAFELAQRVASKSAAAVKIGKQAFYRQADMSLAEAYTFAAEVMTENMMTHDANEGICAFIEKRDPEWEDR